METFHEMIAVDCYCCGVWPSILWLNVRGWALREQRSLHCTAAWLPHEQEAPRLSRPPAADHLLNTQDSRVIVGLNMKGSAHSPGWTITITMILTLFFIFL